MSRKKSELEKSGKSVEAEAALTSKHRRIPMLVIALCLSLCSITRFPPYSLCTCTCVVEATVPSVATHRTEQVGEYYIVLSRMSI